MTPRIALLFAAILMMLAACSGEPAAVYPVSADAANPAPRTIPVHIVSHGWHTGLVIPARALNAILPELGDRFGAPAFYEIGWGDKGFYQAQDITPGLALRALFRSPGTVMHVSAVPLSPQDSFPESQLASFCVSQEEIDALTQFLSGSFSHDEAGHLMPLSKGIYGDSQFYDAAGRYSAANTCNKWTAKALRSAGFGIDPSLKLTAGSVMRYLEHAKAGHACAADGKARPEAETLRPVSIVPPPA